MTLTISIPSESEAVLLENAARVGQTPEEFALAMLRPYIKPPPPPVSPEEFMERIRKIGRPIGACLTDEQLSRENMYD